MRQIDYFKCKCGGLCYQTYISKQSTNFVVKRTRTCEECGKKYTTIEIEYDEYNEGVDKLNKIIDILTS